VDSLILEKDNFENQARQYSSHKHNYGWHTVKSYAACSYSVRFCSLTCWTSAVDSSASCITYRLYASFAITMKTIVTSTVEKSDNVMKAIIWNDMISLAFYKTKIICTYVTYVIWVTKYYKMASIALIIIILICNDNDTNISTHLRVLRTNIWVMMYTSTSWVFWDEANL